MSLGAEPWQRHASEAALADHWARECTDEWLPWHALPLCWVSAHCMQWQSEPMAARRRQYPPATDAVLVCSQHTPDGALWLWGLLPLVSSKGTVGTSLVRRHTLHADERRHTHPPAAPLRHLTLEAVWATNPARLARRHFDPEGEAAWMERALDQMEGLAAGRSHTTPWPTDTEGEWWSAKMRFYVRMCLLHCDAARMNRPAYDLGVDALCAWTARTVRDHCTHEEATARLLADYCAPFDVRTAPPVAWSASACECGLVPLPSYAPSDIARLYASATPPNDQVVRLSTGAAGAWAADDTWVPVGTKDGHLRHSRVDQRIAYRADWPTIFFARGRANWPALCRALCMHGYVPPPRAKFTVEERVAAGVWWVPQLVWPSGRALGGFLRVAGLAHQPTDYATDGAWAVDTFFPHPHKLMVPPGTASMQQGAPADGVMRLFVDKNDGKVYTHAQVPEWIEARVRADMDSIRAEYPACGAYARHLHLDALAATLMREMGNALWNRLASVVAARTARPHTSADVFASRECRRMEAWTLTTAERAIRFFRDLVHPDTAKHESDIRLRAHGSLTFIFGVPGRGTWHEFAASRGGGGGRTLVSLIGHVLQTRDPGVIMAWFRAWFARQDAGDAVTAPPPADAAAPTPKKVDIERQLARIETIKEGSVVQRYLREARGLVDAPRALIEDNAALGAVSRAMYVFDDDETPPVNRPAFVCVTQRRQAMQYVYLDAQSARKDRALPIAKKTKGTLGIDATQNDVVAIWVPPAPATGVRTVVLAEGPETALSVATAVPQWPVYVSLGVENMRKFRVDDAAHTRVIVCRENDARSEHMAAVIRRVLTALRANFAAVECVFPPRGKANYGDFNDVHQQHPGAAGSAIIAQCFARLGGVRPAGCAGGAAADESMAVD